MSAYTSTASTDAGERETVALIAASKVKGTSVYDGAGNSLGSIHDVMLDKRKGQVAYAVLSFGGFLGLGEKYHPIPWNRLTYDEQRAGYVIDLDRSVLEGAPAYSATDASDWSQRNYSNDIDSYYAGQPAAI